MRVERSIEIAAPPEKIWPFLVEPERIMKWWITLRKYDYTSEQHTGIGMRFYVEEKTSGSLMKLNFEITEWVENEKIAFKMTSGTGVKVYEQRWVLEATPSGNRFNFMEKVELPYGIINKLIEPLVRCMSGATINKMLAKLKGLAEAA
jgi:uncharacterized protein YndB with AHSA1/START domain